MTAFVANRLTSIILLFVALCSAAPVLSAEKLRLEITEPFVELRTGPGKAYPKHYVAQRGEIIEVQKRRNDWYKVKLNVNSNRTKIGWLHRRDIVGTAVDLTQLGSDDRMLAKDHPRLHTALNPKFYPGFNYGQSSTADSSGLYGGYNLTPSFAIELQGNILIASDFETTAWSVNGSLTPFDKNWRVAPFFQVGGGGIDNKARRTNSQQNEGSDKFFQVASGVSVLLSKRYRLRFEYRHMNILQSKDANREIETWQAGFIGYF